MRVVLVVGVTSATVVALFQEGCVQTDNWDKCVE